MGPTQVGAIETTRNLEFKTSFLFDFIRRSPPIQPGIGRAGVFNCTMSFFQPTFTNMLFVSLAISQYIHYISGIARGTVASSNRRNGPSQNLSAVKAQIKICPTIVCFQNSQNMKQKTITALLLSQLGQLCSFMFW